MGPRQVCNSLLHKFAVCPGFRVATSASNRAVPNALSSGRALVTAEMPPNAPSALPPS